jgi:hypothetical protein
LASVYGVSFIEKVAKSNDRVWIAGHVMTIAIETSSAISSTVQPARSTNAACPAMTPSPPVRGVASACVTPLARVTGMTSLDG